VRVNKTRHSHAALEINDFGVLSNIGMRLLLVADIFDLASAHNHGRSGTVARAHGVDVSIVEDHVGWLSSASDGSKGADAESEKTASHGDELMVMATIVVNY